MTSTSQGRPTLYTREIADAICLLLTEGKSLRRICARDGMPAESTVRLWVIEDREGFSAQYSRARDMGIDSLVDETIDIADDGRNDYLENEDGDIVVDHDHIKRSTLRVGVRQWYAERIAPKKYGSRQSIDLSTGVSVSDLEKGRERARQRL